MTDAVNQIRMFHGSTVGNGNMSFKALPFKKLKIGQVEIFYVYGCGGAYEYLWHQTVSSCLLLFAADSLDSIPSAYSFVRTTRSVSMIILISRLSE